MVNESLEEVRDMVADLRDRCNVILVVIETALGLGDAEDFAPPEGMFQVDETTWAVKPEQATPNLAPDPFPAEYCPRRDQHDAHEWAYVSELGKGDRKWCHGIPF